MVCKVEDLSKINWGGETRGEVKEVPRDETVIVESIFVKD
jgi:hypothetical protein